MVNVQGVLDQVKVCIIIPVYNESRTIGPLVRALRQKDLDVVVIDDGSVDDSGNIAEFSGAGVIRHARNKGKGASLQEGFQYALARDYEWILTMDGDGQHAVEDIANFITMAQEQPQGVITGNRMSNPQGMPGVRFWTNRLMSAIISFLCRQRIPDTQCGFRMISRDVLRGIQVTCKDYEIETEVLIKASKKGFKIYSVPIQTIYMGEASKINPVVDTCRFIIYIVKEILGVT